MALSRARISGVDIPLERVPLVQKELISKSNRAGKTVITATQMLESMVSSARPTRAEVTDVANAIFDGTDAVMLSGESASGNYPDKSAEMIKKIAKQAEAVPEYNRLKVDTPLIVLEDYVVSAAVKLADRIKAQALVIFTYSGNTARLVSRQRPSVQIIALAHSEEVQRKLELFWGIKSLLRKRTLGLDSLMMYSKS